ncbi:hypothetical protein H3S83_11090 [Bartonella sp. W8122]|uniref:hypothetical protein n=1 Tax=Bartonella TaxID=773 RepID=UPI0018DC27C8|nr:MULTISPECIES: hypothetical protein [Bartonella]MBI0002368.1 hypothetical protein [Bartonella sp. W8122]MBI0164232.1 hypothetical protein [Bartonella sp. M0283]MBI0178315.1 hypothetical protein [Bartonella apis]
MKYIHPFPARMAPEIALEKLKNLRAGQVVLDPMAGSGMVLSQAARNGIAAIGIDIDPLAELISRVGSTSVDENEVRAGLEILLERCLSEKDQVYLPWIDDDIQTKNFIDFWFAPKQKEQLRKLSYYLHAQPINVSKIVLSLLKVTLSRLIITKEPKASLARDTAHSRPHRTIRENDFDVFSAMRLSLDHLLRALDVSSIKLNARTYVGDARKLTVVKSNSVDCIVTSPPYLNAIDYMRGHRLSLVWLGYSLANLRKIRISEIGAERALNDTISGKFSDVLHDLGLDLLERKSKYMLARYFSDLIQQTKEAYRVLKNNSIGTYVIGNSTIRGIYVQNNKLLKLAGVSAGFEVVGETTRVIPDSRRYMPMMVVGNNLAKRMRTEHVIDFKK